MKTTEARSNNSKRDIRVLVADDHPLLREGLCRAIENAEGLTCVGLAANGEEALAMVEKLQPDLAVIDMAMPGIDGIDTARRLKSSHPEIQLIIFSAYGDYHYVMGAMDAGVEGYLLKNTPTKRFLEAIHMVCDGKLVFDLGATRPVLKRVIGDRSKEIDYDGLHERELEVLELATQGMTNKEIAAKLGISENTVGTHFVNIFRKIRVESRTKAGLYALKKGWFSLQNLNNEQDPTTE